MRPVTEQTAIQPFSVENYFLSNESHLKLMKEMDFYSVGNEPQKRFKWKTICFKMKAPPRNGRTGIQFHDGKIGAWCSISPLIYGTRGRGGLVSRRHFTMRQWLVWCSINVSERHYTLIHNELEEWLVVIIGLPDISSSLEKKFPHLPKFADCCHKIGLRRE